MLSRTQWKVFAALVMILSISVVTAVAQRRATQSETFKVKSGGTLVVAAENVHADITIRVGSSGEVKVSVDGLSEEDMEDLEMSGSNNTVTVDYYGGGGKRWHSRQIDIMVEVPEAFNLDLTTSGGDIEVHNKIVGDIEAHTSGGDIEFDAVDGEVDAETSGGDVVMRDVSGDADVRTSGGDIEVGDVKGRLDVHTSGGDIEVGTVDKDLDAKTAGGDIEVGDVGGFADVSTAGGDIRLGNVSGTADVRTAGGDIELLSASGRVTAKTAGGDIVLENITGSIEAETAGGDIIAELIPGGNRGSSFDTAGGDIELSIPHNAKVNIEAEIRVRSGWDDDDDDDWDSRDYDDDYDIYSDFEPDRHDRTKRGVIAEFTLNGGGPLITLETMNGDIEIRKLRR